MIRRDKLFGEWRRTTIQAVALAVTCAVCLGTVLPAAGHGIDINQDDDVGVGLAHSALALVQNRLVFNVDDGLHGHEPWVSNGTTTTELLVDVMPDLDGSDPLGFTAFEGNRRRAVSLLDPGLRRRLRVR